MENGKAFTAGTLSAVSPLRRATCSKQLAQGSLRRATCAEQLAQATCTEHLRRATCAEHLRKALAPTQSNLRKATCAAHFRRASCIERLHRAAFAEQLAQRTSGARSQVSLHRALARSNFPRARARAPHKFFRATSFLVVVYARVCVFPEKFLLTGCFKGKPNDACPHEPGTKVPQEEVLQEKLGDLAPPVRRIFRRVEGSFVVPK